MTSQATVTNSIVWDNTDLSGASIDGDGTNLVAYSDVEGGFAGIGNIDADPMFVDPAGGDLRLQPGSPGIDAGNNWGVAPDTPDLDADGDLSELTPLDLDDAPRFNADETEFDPGCGVPVVVDMGPYEFQFEPVDEVIPGDLDGNGSVNVKDLLALLAAWGPCDKGCYLADLDLDGVVDVGDLLVLLGAWS